jgi:hypothetical protein
VINKYTKSTQVRLEMLERQNRWLTVIAIATIITLLIAATAGPAMVRATVIQPVDQDDKDRAELSFERDAVGLYRKDEDGNNRLRATLDADRYVTNQVVTTAANG